MPSSRYYVVRGPLLDPQPHGAVTYSADGVIVTNAATHRIVWSGPVAEIPDAFADAARSAGRSAGVLSPPFLDLHTHLPQHPIRGRFTEGIDGDPAQGRLLAGLQRNVFPVEARCADPEYAERTALAFAEDTLSHGVVGGSAYGTVHASAAESALRLLSDLWSVGLVLMNINCPDYLRTDESALERDVATLADRYGNRLIVTDRFAVSVDTPLRRRGVALAQSHGLRMQTHLNEQRSEKALIENVLYPEYDSYTDVYRQDGLLDCRPILAHCIQMTPVEWRMAADAGAAVAHCPTSNTLLGSGTLLLDEQPESIPYAICTDVGASPTCSMLSEMAQYLKVHAGRSGRATAEEALYRATLAPGQILGIADRVGSFAPGMPLSYVELALPSGSSLPLTAEDAIRAVLEMPSSRFQGDELADAFQRLGNDGLPYGPQLERLTDDVHATARRLDRKVLRVVLNGELRWQRPEQSPGEHSQ